MSQLFRKLIGLIAALIVTWLSVAVTLVLAGTDSVLNKLWVATDYQLAFTFALFAFMSFWVHLWLSPFILAFSLIVLLIQRIRPSLGTRVDSVLAFTAIALLSGFGGEFLLWRDERPKCPDSISSWFCIQVQYLHDTDPLIMGLGSTLDGPDETPLGILFLF